VNYKDDDELYDEEQYDRYDQSELNEIIAENYSDDDDSTEQNAEDNPTDEDAPPANDEPPPEPPQAI
jgi:hypothetical protein